MVGIAAHRHRAPRGSCSASTSPRSCDRGAGTATALLLLHDEGAIGARHVNDPDQAARRLRKAELASVLRPAPHPRRPAAAGIRNRVGSITFAACGHVGQRLNIWEDGASALPGMRGDGLPQKGCDDRRVPSTSIRLHPACHLRPSISRDRCGLGVTPP